MFKQKSFSYNLMWNSIGSFSYLFSQFTLVAITVKLSSNFENSGIISLAISIANIFYTIAHANSRPYLVSDTKRSHEDSYYVGFRILTSVLAFILCFVYILFFSYTVQQMWSIMLYMLFRIIEVIADLMHAFGQREHRMDIGGKSLLLRGILSFIAFVVTLMLTNDINLSIVSMIVVTFLVIYLYDYPQVKKFTKFQAKFDFQEMKMLFYKLFPLTVASLLSIVAFVIPRQILEKMEGINAFGIYTAIATPAVFVQVAATYVFNPMIVTFAEYINNKQKRAFLSLFYRTSFALVAISIASLIGIYFLGDVVLKIVFNQEILEYSDLFIVIILLSCLNAFVLFLWNILVIFRSLKYMFIIYVVGFLFVLVASTWFIDVFGMNGVSLVLIVYCLFVIAGMLLVLANEIRTKFIE